MITASGLAALRAVLERNPNAFPCAARSCLEALLELGAHRVNLDARAAWVEAQRDPADVLAERVAELEVAAAAACQGKLAREVDDALDRLAAAAVAGPVTDDQVDAELDRLEARLICTEVAPGVTVTGEERPSPEVVDAVREIAAAVERLTPDQVGRLLEAQAGPVCRRCGDSGSVLVTAAPADEEAVEVPCRSCVAGKVVAARRQAAREGG